jgi:hypothetical protein
MKGVIYLIYISAEDSSLSSEIHLLELLSILQELLE